MKKQNRFLPALLLALVVSCASPAPGKDKDTPTGHNTPHKVLGVSHYGRVFGDLNATQLDMAQAIGITPLASRSEVGNLSDRLHLIRTCEHYAVDPLTHSIPYLVPGAARLLDDIGANFLDSLAIKGLKPNKVIVTSVLRTEEDVRRLRQRNGNATAASAHAYGTTFDISWCRFEEVKGAGGKTLRKANAATLKMVLAEVLRDLKQEGRCYVKYEVKQACFHITTRQ